MDPFQVLGISYGASNRQVKVAYRRLNRLWTISDNPYASDASKRLEQIKLAHDVLLGKSAVTTADLASLIIEDKAYREYVFDRANAKLQESFLERLPAQRLEQQRLRKKSAKLHAKHERTRLREARRKRRARTTRRRRLHSRINQRKLNPARR